MTAFAQARAADKEGRIEEAALLYEEGLARAPNDIEARLNLVVLYWQSTDYGVWKTTGLSKSFVEAAGKRYRELLDGGRAMFPDDPALRFWTKYTQWTDLGREFEPAECRELLANHPEYLEPIMYLYSVSQGSECEREAHELLQKYRGVSTSRARYVVSVIEAVAKRAGR